MRSSSLLDRLLELLVGLRQRRAAQHRLHAAAELAHREGLSDVVVGAQLEAEHLVDLLGLRGEHDDRHRRARADLAADVEAVDLGHHHVEHHEVEVVLAQAFERLTAVERAHHVVALLAERVGQQLLNRELVVHEQDPGCGGRHLRNCRLRRCLPSPDDRTARIQSGVRPRSAGPGTGHVLAPEQARAAAPGPGSGRAVRRSPGRRRGRGHRLARARSPRRHAGRPAHRAAGAQPVRGARLPRARAAALQPRRPGARERDRPARGPLAAADRDRGRPRRRRGARRPRQRRRHRRAPRACARVRGPPHAQDARARLGGRLEPRRGGHQPAGGGAAGARPGGRRAGDVGPRLIHPPRPGRAGLVERHAPRGHRAAAHGGRVDPARARGRGRGVGLTRPARPAVVPDRARPAGSAARSRLRRGGPLGQRCAAARPATDR